MFPNIEAEQHRRKLTNVDVAKLLGISRTTYEKKKRIGNFSRNQIILLCDYFNCNFEYLFATEIEVFDKSLNVSKFQKNELRKSS